MPYDGTDLTPSKSPLSNRSQRRIRKIADFLRHKVPQQQFNMGIWDTGKQACIGGWTKRRMSLWDKLIVRDPGEYLGLAGNSRTLFSAYQLKTPQQAADVLDYYAATGKLMLPEKVYEHAL